MDARAWAGAVAISLYGAAGTFGGLAGQTSTPSGQPLAPTAVRDWGFLPGQSAYFPAIGSDGTVLIANEPQTDNQFRPTARQMVISEFTPATRRFRNIVIPTSAGRSQLGGPWASQASLVGGADVSDIEPIQVGGRQRIAFTSAMPYWGWDARRGVFPTLGVLSRTAAGGWAPDAHRSLAAADIRGQQSTSQQACSQTTAPTGVTVGDCHLPAEFAQLPSSKQLVLTQYGYDDPARHSGRISVLSPTGRVQASYAYPQITLPSGEQLAVHPREVDVDPLGRRGDERFVVIFDAERAAGGLSPFAMQEFRYDRARRTITPTSLPILSGDRAADGAPLSFETARYGAAGSLWAAQSEAGTLQAGPLAIFHRAAGSPSVLAGRPGCAAPTRWNGGGWSAACPPDERITEATPLGIARSLTQDDATGAMVLVTLSGSLLPVRPTAGSAEHAAAAPVDLGLGRLVDRTTVNIGPRKGAEDQRTRTLWVPVQELATGATCAAWPCAPRSLNQWLYGIDLATLLRQAP